MIFLLFTVFLLSAVVEGQESYAVRAANVGHFSVQKHPLTVSLNDLPPAFRNRHLTVGSDQGKRVPSQVDDLNGDGKPEKLCFFADIPGNRSRIYTIHRRQSKPERSSSELDVHGSGTFQNSRLTVKREPEGHLFSILDRKSGKALVNNWGLRRGELKFQDSEVVATGPVRTVFEQYYSVKGSPLTLTERYILYAGQRRLDLNMIFHNPTDRRQSLPDWTANGKNVVKGRHGSLMMENWSGVEILSVNFYETNRKNIMWVNPETGYGLGVSLHMPYCDSYGPTLWINPVYKSLSGRVTHARPQHDWVVPGAEPAEYKGRADRSRSRGDIGGFGRFAHVTSSVTDQTYKARRGKKGRPYRVEPGGQQSLGMSLVFYHNSSDPSEMIHRFENDADGVVGTVNVYHESDTDQPPLQIAGAPEHFTDDFDAELADRWLIQGRAKLAVEGGKARLTALEDGSGMRTYFSRDFLYPPEVRGQVASLSNGATVRVHLKDLDTGKTYLLGEVGETGSFRRSVKEKVPFNDYRRCALQVTVHGGEDGPSKPQARFDSLTFGWISPPAPELVTPLEGMKLTDLAMAVALISRTPQRADRGYQVQVADNQQFRDPVMDETFSLKMRVSGASHRDRTFLPDNVLEKGTYYCRVRALGIDGNPGQWTRTRPFRIDSTNHEPGKLKRSIGPENPVFLIPATNAGRFIGAYKRMPERVRKHVIPVVNYEKLVNSPNRLKGWMEADVPFILRFYGHTAGNLSYTEHLFRKNPDLLGLVFGESGFPGKSMKRGLKLAAKYGRYAGNYGQFKQLGMGSEQEFYDLLQTHGRYILSLPKGQHPGFIGERYSPLTGLWLIDRLEFWACETEYWVPHHLGIHDEDQHAVDWMAPFLFGLSTGASGYRVETFISGKHIYGWPNNRLDDFDHLTRELGPLWTHAMGAFFTDVIKHDLIPGKKAVKKKIDVAMRSKREYLTNPFAFPKKKIMAAHGQPSHNRQWIPEKNRGYLVPMLPPLATEPETNRFRHTVMPDEFQSVDAAEDYFAEHNPPDTSEAYAVRVGDTIVITNTHPEDHPDDDVPVQGYTRSLTKGPVASIEGEMGYHQYIIGKQKPDELFLHANNYPHQSTTITLHPRTRKLDVTVKPESALESRKNTSGGIQLKVQHDKGPVRILAR